MTSLVGTANTAYRAICEAYEDAGWTAQGDVPNSEQLATGYNRLNDIFNTFQTQGLKLWLNEDFAITPIVGQYQYNLGPSGTIIALKPMRVLEGYYVDSNNNRRPVIPMSRQEWDTLATINTQGTLTSYFVDKQQSSLYVNLWLTPDSQTATGTFHPILQVQVQNQVQLTDTMNFPIEWFLALKWTLSEQVSQGQPKAIQAKCAANSTRFMTMLEDWDVEDAATSFAPDTRTMNYQGRFV
jgi:hypothetical protein